jgi:FkbM family methyltransferase
MQAFRIDPLALAYNQKGILKWQNPDLSGELYVLTHAVPKLLAANKDRIIFDIGANTGSYSRLLHTLFPGSQIYAFEPNPIAFNILSEKLAGTGVKLFNVGMSDVFGQSKLMTYANGLDSEHATLFPDVLTDIHGSQKNIAVAIDLTTLEAFCDSNDVDRIDFVKIDTEGNEYRILCGAKKMLDSGQIKIIQFEFNEMNVISRVFLKDFFDLLADVYHLYRLDTSRLIPLFKYDAIDEIFKFQNILAVLKKIDTLRPAT